MSFLPTGLAGGDGADLLNPISPSPTMSVGPQIPSASQPLAPGADPNQSSNTPGAGTDVPVSLAQGQGTSASSANGAEVTSFLLPAETEDQDQPQPLSSDSPSTPVVGLIPSTFISTTGVPAISSIQSLSSVIVPSTHPATLLPSSPSTSILGSSSSESTSIPLSGTLSSGLLSATLTSGLPSNPLLSSTATASRTSSTSVSLSQITAVPSTSSESLTADTSPETEDQTVTDSPSESLVPIVVTSTGDDTTLFISMTSTVQHNANASPSADLAAANSDDKTEGNILNSDNKLFPLGVVLVVIGGLIVLITLLVFTIRCLGVTRRRRRLRAAIPSFFPTIPEHDHSNYNDNDDENEKYDHIASTEYLARSQAGGAGGHPAYEEYVVGNTHTNGTGSGNNAGNWYDPASGTAGVGGSGGGGHQRNISDGSFGNDISSALGTIGAGAAGVGAGVGAGGYGEYPAQPPPAHAASPPRGIAAYPYGGQEYTYGVYSQDTGPYPAIGMGGPSSKLTGTSPYQPTSDPYGGAYFPGQGQSQGTTRNLTPTRNNSQSSNGSSYSYGSDTRLAYQDDSRMDTKGTAEAGKDKIRQMGYF
ncbi:hypothetical protein I317_06492 [Kwoniella heveanensis CBS 569]|nr:hypothetical protein I317_06492 [Kwoniella heveanensis CBS 569]